MKSATTVLLLLAASLAAAAGGAATAGDGLDRTVLPIPEPPVAPVTELDARNATAPPRFQVKAPEGAPNVVIVLIDDMGFGQSSTFGGPIHMPTLDRMASAGLRYNNFHTTALCSPTRVALLTGHNHHANNAGAVMELATSFPGNTGVRPRSITPLAETLRQNGCRHTIHYEFIPDAATPGAGGRSILSVDGQKVAEGHIPKTQPFAFSGDEGADVGVDGETNVSNEYAQGDNAFTGTIQKVTVEVK